MVKNPKYVFRFYTITQNWFPSLVQNLDHANTYSMEMI